MDYLTLLEQGIDQWNRWRASHPNAVCSLKGKDLAQGYFFEGNFQGVDLRGANLQRACLVGANFQNADLTGANLSGAYLDDANFYGANLTNANFTKAALARVDMRRANLLGTQLTEVDLRSIKLPDPAEPYSVEAVFPIASPPIIKKQTAQKQTAQKQTVQQKAVRQKTNKQQAVATPPAAAATTLLSKEKPVANKSTWMNRVMAPFTVRSRENAKDIADRQQSIRLSAIPTRQTKKSASKTQPLIAKTPSDKRVDARRVNTKKQKAKKTRTNRPVALPQQPTKKTLATQNAVRSLSTAQSDQRQSDQRLATLLGHSVRQRPSWMPILAAAGIVVTVGLPFAIPTIVNSQQQTTAQSATALTLAKSLTGTAQIQEIATHTPTNGNPQIIAGDSNGNIQIWDEQTGETLQILIGQGEGIQAIAISASGQWLVSSSSEGLTVWNPDTGERIHTLPTTSDTIGAVAITPDERTFLSSDETGSIAAWDIATGQQRYHLNSGEAAWDIAIAPDGQSFVSVSGHHIHQRDLAAGKILQTFTDHTDAVRSIAISPDGTTLASGSWDHTIKLWNLATGDLQTTLNGHTDRIASLAISADGKTLASSSDRTLKLWDIPSRQLTKTLDPSTDTVVAITFTNSDSPNDATENAAQSPTLISGGSQTINIWQ